MQTKTESTAATWTRREFVRAAAGFVALPYLDNRSAHAIDHSPHFAYVAGSNSITVYAATEVGPGWSPVQRVSSQAPAHLLLSPAHQVLYVANEVAMHEGISRGTVETFGIKPVDGTLSLLGCTPLSLSATRPRHLALSPDGKLLAVAAYGGGICNLLPVAADGSLGAPCGVFKEAGCGPHAVLQTSAHPHSLFFDASGNHLLSTDLGCDRISVFAVNDGRLTRKTLHAPAAGSGPGACILHPAGFLYAAHELADRLVCYRYDATSWTFTETARQATSAASLALHPSSHVLYGTHAQSRILQVWQVNTQSGKLTQTQSVSLGEALPTHVSAAPDGTAVYVLAGNTGSIIKLIADPAGGELLAQTNVAKVSSPRSIALRMI